jgi:hypothetical protein
MLLSARLDRRGNIVSKIFSRSDRVRLSVLIISIMAIASLCACGGGSTASPPPLPPAPPRPAVCSVASATSASAQTRVRLGAYYFDGWSGPLTNFHFGGLVNGPYQDHKPLSGWQDNTACAVEQQLAWAHSFGIDFFVFDWYFNTTVNDPGENLNSALKFTHAMPNRHGMQFAILYVDQPPFTISTSADWSSAINEWLGYMTDPAYVLINGKPYFGVIDMRAMRQAFGSSSAVASALSQVRATAQAKGFPDVYIVGGFNTFDGSSGLDGLFPDLSMAKADGYDAVSMYAYGFSGPLTASGVQPFSELSDVGTWIWNQGALNSPLPFIPVAMSGWDARPWGENEPGRPAFWFSRSPQEVTTFVSDAITWAESNPQVRPEPSPTPPVVLIEAWNELGEGSYLVPTMGDGSSYGDSLASMLATSPTQVRSVLTLNDSGPSDPNRTASGKLTDASGAGIAGASLTLTYTPSSGTYTPQYQLSGQAPPTAAQAVVGFRVNTDYPTTWPSYFFAGPGPSDFSLYQVAYVQPSDGIQRVPDGDFSSAPYSWTLQRQTQIVASDRGTGQMVQVVAASSQLAMLDSAPFAVTGGAAFQLTFAARVAPSSFGSGYFFLAFLDGSGNFLDIPGISAGALKSETVPLVLGKLTVGTATTDAAGNYQLNLTSLGTSQLILEATFAGDAQHWPAYASVGP